MVIDLREMGEMRLVKIVRYSPAGVSAPGTANPFYDGMDMRRIVLLMWKFFLR